MLKTITGYWDAQNQVGKSLIYMKQNDNGTNLPSMNGENTKFLLRDVYVSALRELSDTIKNYPGGLFTQIFQNVCKNSIEEVKNIITAYVKRHNLIFSDEEIKRICDKYRGNFGEIVFEILATKGLIPYCDPLIEHKIVDPDNEHRFDQVFYHMNDGYPLYVQIKNYSSKLPQDKAIEFFDDCIFNRIEGEKEFREDKDKWYQFVSTPHTMLFSFSDCDEWIKKNFKQDVIWIGPDVINFIPNISKIYGPYDNAINEILALT